MLPDRVSNPGPLTYESGALPIALRGPANSIKYVAKVAGRRYDSARAITLSKMAQIEIRNHMYIFI